jgi:hypothetical protein
VGKDKLSEIHSVWIEYCWNPELDHDVSLQAFRGSFKSTAIIHIGPIYYFAFHNPNDVVFIVRKDFTAASDAVETTYNMMMASEITALFTYLYGYKPKAVIKRKEKITFNFKKTITPEGNLNPLGLDPSIAGKHGDRFMIDDFVNLKDRISKAERENTKGVIREIATNVANPGKPKIYVGTPWHKLDAWSICPAPVQFTVHDLPILTEEEIVRKRSTTTSSLWAANYELKHVSDDDALFKNPHFAPWKDRGTESVRAHLDAAFDGDHYNALTIMARRYDGKLQGIGFIYQGNIREWAQQVVNICKRFKVKLLYNEDNPDKGYVGDDLRSLELVVKSYTETMNKHVKIATYLHEAWDDIYWDEDITEPEYLNQILDYREKQEPDDSPDSVASLVRAEYAKASAARIERWRW